MLVVDMEDMFDNSNWQRFSWQPKRIHILKATSLHIKVSKFVLYTASCVWNSWVGMTRTSLNTCRLVSSASDRYDGLNSKVLRCNQFDAAIVSPSRCRSRMSIFVEGVDHSSYDVDGDAQVWTNAHGRNETRYLAHIQPILNRTW